MKYSVTLLATGFVTHDVRRFVIERPEGFAFEPGQGVELAVDLPGWSDRGRPFTPTSLAEERIIEFTIKIYPEHAGVTERLAALQPGARLSMSEPFGTIRYRGPGTFIAAGAGITPFLAILRRLARDGRLAGHRVIFANKRPQDVICGEELRHYLGEALTLLCSREAGADCRGGRVDEEFLDGTVRDHDQPFYVCGPPPFVESVNGILTRAGARPDALVFEK